MSNEEHPPEALAEVLIDEDAAALLPLLAAETRILHPRDHGEGFGGGDVDCAVADLDEQWPLRLPKDWRFCQCLHYDITGWEWVLEREGRTVLIDSLDDPRGIGKYAFPTGLALGGPARSSVRASYLTVKRLRKGIRSAEAWNAIQRLAAVDPEDYVGALQTILGERLGHRVGSAVLEAGHLDKQLWAKAKAALKWRRIRDPRRLALVVIRSTARVLERVIRPTGLFVVIVGPDGTGKSTLARGLPQALEGMFRRHAHFHWRPSLLPAVGSIAGSSPADPTSPHSRARHGALISTARLLYYWVDFVVGAWMRLWPVRVRSGLVVAERWWWDIAVDPFRYRMRVFPGVLKFLERMILSPDLTIVLEASPELLTGRKDELPQRELERQSLAWRAVMPEKSERLFIDASASEEEVMLKAREGVLGVLERRAFSRLGKGWTGVPRKSSARWILPRSPRAVARAALSIYQPVTIKSRLGWGTARLVAQAGGFRLLPRSKELPTFIQKTMATFVPPGGSLAVMRANHPDRFIALVIADDGRCLTVGKIAADHEGRNALATEAKAIREFGSHLGEPLSAPAILAQTEDLLLLEAVAWRSRSRPWLLPEEVAVALGLLYRSGSKADQAVGIAHGDCAPWNLLRTDQGWTLIDWEMAREGAPPFFDVFHYLIQSHSLLGRPSFGELQYGIFREEGTVGSAITAYKEGAGLNDSAKEGSLELYLRLSMSGIDDTTKDGLAGLRARSRLLESMTK